MSKFFSCIVPFLGILSATAQLYLKPIDDLVESGARITNNSEIRFKQNTLPFWDDFSISTDGNLDSIRVWESDTTRQWDLENSHGVFVNSTLAINPPSYGIVTFDGLDENGQFHGSVQGLTDELVSDELDLSNYSQSDDIYLSFYWQAGGNVEAPDKGDSLTLAFHKIVDNTAVWETIWSMDGADVTSDSLFFQEVVQLEERFISSNTRFKFSAYGDQNGPFDAWHIDWVYMNANRGNDDFYYEDVSINGDLSLLFGPFKSIPKAHFAMKNFITLAKSSAMNLNPEPDRIGLDLNYIMEISDQTENIFFTKKTRIIEIFSFLNEDPLVINARGSIDFGEVSLTGIRSNDFILIEAKASVDATNVEFLDNGPVNLRINDTVRTEYRIQDSYAYDDGTAEFAAGINTSGGQISLQYWVQSPDTLTHIDLYIPNITPSSANKSLELRVFEDLSENILLAKRTVEIETATAINQFTRYALNRPIIVSDTFYIGYQQDVNEYIGVGFDRSNPIAASYVYENLNDQWVQNDRLKGALMIRPVFKSGFDIVANAKTTFENKLAVYPNPITDVFRISGNYHRIVLSDVSGKVLINDQKRDAYTIRSFPNGIYFLIIYTSEGVFRKRIVKR